MSFPLSSSSPPIFESVVDNIENLCKRVKKSLQYLARKDRRKPVFGGLNESGLKLLFISALQDDAWHVEAEFKLGSRYLSLLLTPKKAPFDVAVVFDIKYTAAPFIVSKQFLDCDVDEPKFEALRRLKSMDIIKLRVKKSGYKGPVNVAQVLLDSSNQAKSHADKLLRTTFFPCVLSVGVVGVGPCLVTQIEATGDFATCQIQRPMINSTGPDLTRFRQRVVGALSQVRGFDGDCEARRSGLTTTGFKMAFVGALHDAPFVLQSQAKIEEHRRENEENQKRRHRRHHSDSSRSPSPRRRRSASGGRNLSGLAAQTLARIRARDRSARESNGRRGRSESFSRSRSRSPDDENSDFSDEGEVDSQRAGPIPLLLLSDRATPTNAIILNTRYFHVNNTFENDPATGRAYRFGDKKFHQDEHGHARRAYFNEELKKLSALSQNDLEQIQVAATPDGRIQTVGSIARAVTGLTFRQSQAILQRYRQTLRTIVLVTAVGVGAGIHWLQEVITNPLFQQETKMQEFQAEARLLSGLQNNATKQAVAIQQNVFLEDQIPARLAGAAGFSANPRVAGNFQTNAGVQRSATWKAQNIRNIRQQPGVGAGMIATGALRNSWNSGTLGPRNSLSSPMRARSIPPARRASQPRRLPAERRRLVNSGVRAGRLRTRSRSRSRDSFSSSSYSGYSDYSGSSSDSGYDSYSGYSDYSDSESSDSRSPSRSRSRSRSRSHSRSRRLSVKRSERKFAGRPAARPLNRGPLAKNSMRAPWGAPRAAKRASY